MKNKSTRKYIFYNYINLYLLINNYLFNGTISLCNLIELYIFKTEY